MPRGLICSHSVYFQKAFSERFKEGQEKTIALSDVKPWIFECFIGWLYTQAIFYSGNLRSEPEVNDDEDAATATDTNHHHARESGRNTPREMRDPTDGTMMSDAPASAVGQECDGQPVGEREDDQDDGDSDSEGEDEDYDDDPVTWYYSDLFDLYIFADKYDSKGMRQAVMEIVQIKIMQCSPRSYYFPANEDFLQIYEKLPASSPMYILLVHVQAFDVAQDNQTLRQHFESMPADVMSQVLVLMKQMVGCYECSLCRKRKQCTDKTHSDIKIKPEKEQRDVCRYHEHTSEEEERLCRLRWIAIREEFGIPGPDGEPW